CESHFLFFKIIELRFSSLIIFAAESATGPAFAELKACCMQKEGNDPNSINAWPSALTNCEYDFKISNLVGLVVILSLSFLILSMLHGFIEGGILIACISPLE